MPMFPLLSYSQTRSGNAPTRPEYRQGATLGDEHKHWFRAKFFRRCRLFFRYHRESRIIIYMWVNDEDTKRTYQSGSGAYRTFRRMPKDGNPPDGWEQLLKQVKLVWLLSCLRIPQRFTNL
jgi:toxin YhaV